MFDRSTKIKRCVVLAGFFIGAFAAAGGALAAGAPVERVIDLQGTTNTRDIGGYAVDDARTVRMGRILRSENLSRLTPDDFRALEAIGVKTVIDLRSVEEARRKPTAWQGENPPEFHHFPIGDADNDWFRRQGRMLQRNRFTEEQALEHMVEGYRMIAEDGPEAYRELMAVVLDEANWPVLIHCNAGKDRTGVAVALILEALGVERDVIMQEYLLTNEVGRSREKAELMARESRKNARIKRGPSAEAWYPIVGVRSEMLEAFYASVEARYGSVDAYLGELGVDPEARERLVDGLTAAGVGLAMGE